MFTSPGLLRAHVYVLSKQRLSRCSSKSSSLIDRMDPLPSKNISGRNPCSNILKQPQHIYLFVALVFYDKLFFGKRVGCMASYYSSREWGGVGHVLQAFQNRVRHRLTLSGCIHVQAVAKHHGKQAAPLTLVPHLRLHDDG